MFEYFLIPTVIAAVVVGYFTASRQADRKHGEARRKMVDKILFNIIKVLSPMFLYGVVAVILDRWNMLLMSTEFSICALILFVMAAYELSMGFSLHHRQPINPKQLKLFAVVPLLGISLSSVSTVLVFYSGGAVSNVAIGVQVLLLCAAISVYFVNAVIVNAVKIRHA